MYMDFVFVFSIISVKPTQIKMPIYSAVSVRSLFLYVTEDFRWIHILYNCCKFISGLFISGALVEIYKLNMFTLTKVK